MAELTASQNSRRIPALDSLRGLAALSVFFGHTVGMHGVMLHPGFWQELNFTPVRAIWAESSAVTLFFVLSGFVLSLPYFSPKAKPIEVLSFAVRRILRIYPAYFVALFLALALQAWVFIPGMFDKVPTDIHIFWASPISWNEVFQHIVFFWPGLTSSSINAVFWSIFVELKVSILFPFALIGMTRWKQKPLIACLGLALFLGSVVFLSKVAHYVPFFILGMLLVAYLDPLQEWFRQQGVLRQLGILLLGLALYTQTYSLRCISRHSPSFLEDDWTAIGAALIILCVASEPLLQRFLAFKPIEALGKISYSFYLVHLPILLTCLSISLSRSELSINQGWLLGTAVALLLSVLLSRLLFKYVELPMQNRGRKLADEVSASTIRIFGANMPTSEAQ